MSPSNKHGNTEEDEEEDDMALSAPVNATACF